jgi:hypothetical protein
MVPDGGREATEVRRPPSEPVITKDATVGRRLWDESERITITDMRFVATAPANGMQDRPCLMTQGS